MVTSRSIEYGMQTCSPRQISSICSESNYGLNGWLNCIRYLPYKERLQKRRVRVELDVALFSSAILRISSQDAEVSQSSLNEEVGLHNEGS